MKAIKEKFKRIGIVPIPENTRQRIKDLAQYGDQKVIADKCKVTQNYVSQVISDGRGKLDVVREIVSFYKEKEREVSELAG